MSDRVQLDSNHLAMMAAVRAERQRQLEKWGIQRHPHGTGSELAQVLQQQWKEICDANHAAGKDDWLTIAGEEFMEAASETDLRKLFDEVVQNAAVFVAWGEAIIDEIRKQGNQ
ncbi:hypothetical protein SEA_LIZZ_47 [Streptomyces phage Lizz]|nr:hypothetical protein SEA_PHTOWN_47 [Streptomyces phage PHTowN]QNO12864.1 hypothetical protein SEA_SHAKENBAKE_47 [Streptomyces phage ShakeNBake]QYW07594.1 hypothetical protein SEA_LIZZ_47 [Streptomyces phage Lizz]